MHPAVPLTDRPPNAVIFRLPEGCVTAAEFTADAMHLAEQLPRAPYAINLCVERYAFAVAFAAALLRGQTSLLASDRSVEQVDALIARFPGAYPITDATVPPPGAGRAVSIPAIPADQIAAIVFTSGSTGTPVAHAKNWQALVERSRDAGAAFGFTAQTPATVIGTVPPQHMYGFETTVLLPLHAHTTTWCGPAFYSADISGALSLCGAPCVLITTPLQLRALLQTPQLPAVARIISATAPLDPVMAEAAERQWGTLVSEIFGASEVGSIAFRRTRSGPGWTPYAQIRLSSNGDSVSVGAPGIPDTMLDDNVELLGDGTFRLLGRRTDVVKLGGRRASLAGLNRALAAIEGVEDGAFLPPPAEDHHASARMTAFVVAPLCDGDTILAALRKQIDPVFLPRRIVHVDRLPRNELGKLPMGALRTLQAAS